MTRRTLFQLLLFCSTALAGSVSTQPATEPAAAKHVLLIGLDGARADAIRDHAGPAVRSLIKRGTVCWNAQAVLPSVTQVNWPSILTGCLPATHGVDMNPVIELQLRQVKLKVPTLFDLIARHGSSAAGFLGHWKLYTCDTHTPGAQTFHSSYQANTIGDVAANYILKNKPTFCFVYIGDLDGIGHREGWMSPAYLDGVSTVDLAIQKLLDALKGAGIADQTTIFLTSDHGGDGKSHSEGSPLDRTIPWIAAGPGIGRGQVINQPISTTDTAPTILRILGIPQPDYFDGHTVTEALADPTVLAPK